MQRPAQGLIPGRPNRPFVVRCAYDGSTRRVQFPSAATCRIDSLRTRVEECFALSAWPFFLTYTDDDGEVLPIKNESELTEAIAYFVSGDDDPAASAYGGSEGLGARGATIIPGFAAPAQKITMRVDVVVEYDGPSLSDTSSIASFPSSENSWASSGSGSGSSARMSRYTDGQRSDAASYLSYDRGGRTPSLRSSSASVDIDDTATLDIDSLSISSSVQRRSQRIRDAAAGGGSAYSATASGSSGLTPRLSGRQYHPPSLAPEPGYHDGPPSLLTSSELGSRWLREQSQLANRIPHLRVARRYDSDNDSVGSDEESLGDIALVRDARGRYYYSYQTTDTASLFSRSDAGEWDGVAGPSGRPASIASRSTHLTHISPPDAHEPHEIPRVAEPADPPIFAPDCAACGLRLEYMRYVCMSCGEGDMYKADDPNKAPFVPPGIPSDFSDDTESSDGTVWGEGARARSQSSGRSASAGSATVYNASRSRSGSISTNASILSLAVTNGSAMSLSPTDGAFLAPTPDTSPRRVQPRGYELCPGCIEAHGIAHSVAAVRTRDAQGRKQRGGLRHTFREKIWGAEGWIDVDYSEEADCTICNTKLLNSRFKCVSCTKFDLCRSCYQKVDEIHPVHVFLSVPDKPLPQIAPPPSSAGGSEARPIRHPGAFCHNCLQDIVGPRFHCAVCPSWDLCIQCEGVSAPGDGQHTSDHIMMKIPIPLGSSEVEAVSRRARDRWFQQDSSIAAASAASSSSRSSSPTIDGETVYAPTPRLRNAEARAPGSTTSSTRLLPSTAGSTTSGRRTPMSTASRVIDDLDHNARCANCNEWIMGRRYQCANCPSDPEPYNLCSICELRSYRVHDPRHVFFKFDRPVHVSLHSTRALLPLLYKTRVGQVPSTAVLNARDPTAYLKHVLHRETLCDIHSDQIRGIWLRCAHCAAGFDICSEAEQVADHDPTHVFVVFKARVDMTAFRQLADLAATHSKPLLSQQVYLS